MAFGFPPRYIHELQSGEVTTEQWLVLGIEAAKTLGWNVGATNENGFIAYTNISLGSWSEEVSLQIETDRVILKSVSIGSQLVDFGINKRNIKELLSQFQKVKGTTIPDDVSSRFLEIKQTFGPATSVTSLDKAPKHVIKRIFSVFVPRESYVITPIVLDINILVFILMCISGVSFFLPDNESLIAWGANFRPVTMEGESWRLITACFVHIGLIHLLMNMYALLYISQLLEPHLGKLRFASAYIFSGVLSSLSSLAWHDLTISAGASGAIFGLYGVFLSMLTTNLIDKAAREALLPSIIIFVGYNLLNGLKGGIDNAAHVGGLISGIIIGYSFYPGLKRPDERNVEYTTVALLTIFALLISLVVYHTIPNNKDIQKYQAKMKEFAAFETMALEVYQRPQNTPKDELLLEIKQRGIYYWKECLNSINESEALNLPKEFHDRNKQIKNYIELRIKSYELVYKGLDENTDKYKPQIENYDRQIEGIIRELTGKQK